MEERQQMAEGILALFTGTFLFFWLAVIVLVYASYWKICTKAGRQGWEGIIPIYNIYVLLKIGGKPGWWLLLILFVPFGGLIWGIWMLNMVSKSFGKNEGFTVGLLFLPFIFFPILGFGSAKYLGPYGNPAQFAAAQQPHFDFDQNKPS